MSPLVLVQVPVPCMSWHWSGTTRLKFASLPAARSVASCVGNHVGQRALGAREVHERVVLGGVEGDAVAGGLEGVRPVRVRAGHDHTLGRYRRKALEVALPGLAGGG